MCRTIPRIFYSATGWGKGSSVLGVHRISRGRQPRRNGPTTRAEAPFSRKPSAVHFKPRQRPAHRPSPPRVGVGPGFYWPVWRNSIFPTVRSFPKQCTAQKLPSHWLQTTQDAHPGSHTAPHSMQATCTSLQRHEHAYFFHAWGWGACCGVRGVRPNVPSFVLLPRLASRLPPSPRLRYPAQLPAAATLAQAAATGLLPCPGFSHPAPATWLLLPCSSCCHLAAAGHPAQCPPGCSYIYPAPAASWLLLPPRPSYCHPAAATRLLPPGCCHPAALPCTSCLLLLPCPALAACCCQPATLTRLRPSYCHLPPPQLLPPGCCHLDAASWTLLLPPGCSAATRLLCCHPATLLPPGCSAATRLLCCHPAALLPPVCCHPAPAATLLPPCPSYCHPAAPYSCCCHPVVPFCHPAPAWLLLVPPTVPPWP